MDFNPTYFAHPMAADGFTLAHPDEGIRRFWIEHGIACRQIGAAIGKALGTPCVTNVWIPTAPRIAPSTARGRASGWPTSLDEIFAEPIDPRYNRDAVEGKLFGIGSESYVVGSHEFYLGYAISRKQAAVPRRRPFPSDRSHLRQDLGGAHATSTRSCCTSAGACAGTATTW